MLHEPRQLGAGVAVARIVPQLAALGWSATAWVPGRGPLADMLREQGAEVVVGPERPFAFSLARLRGGEGRDLRALADYWRAFNSFLHSVQPHLVHANTLLAIPEALAARRHGIPTVMHVHELPSPGKKTSVALRVVRRITSTAIAVSPEVAALLCRALPADRVHLVVNGVDVPDEPGQPAANAAFQIGTLGSASRRKGTDIFFDVVDRLTGERDDVRFHHVGDWEAESDRSFVDELTRRADDLVERGALTVHGSVAKPASLVRNWDLFVLPSRQDPYPLALLEAMSLGVPAVAADVGGIAGIIRDRETGILARPDSVQSVAAAVSELLDDPNLRKQVASAGRTHVRENNSLEAQADGVSAAYLQTLASQWRPSAKTLAR